LRIRQCASCEAIEERKEFGVTEMSEEKKKSRRPRKRKKITSEDPPKSKPTKESLEKLKEIAREKGWAVR
jgi:hypothetical protein